VVVSLQPEPGPGEALPLDEPQQELHHLHAHHPQVDKISGGGVGTRIRFGGGLENRDRSGAVVVVVQVR
jgi:hypothetical protein